MAGGKYRHTNEGMHSVAKLYRDGDKMVGRAFGYTYTLVAMGGGVGQRQYELHATAHGKGKLLSTMVERISAKGCWYLYGFNRADGVKYLAFRTIEKKSKSNKRSASKPAPYSIKLQAQSLHTGLVFPASKQPPTVGQFMAYHGRMPTSMSELAAFSGLGAPNAT